jgi:pyridoxine 4-dehydrogenase
VTPAGDRHLRRIGLGGAELAVCSDQTAATALLRRALELGVDLIDTADVYGGGESERRIARALHPYPAGVTIATKGGFTIRGKDAVPDGRPEHLRAACLESLRRLRVEAIDLYLLHTPDPDVPLEESLGALTGLRDEGRIRRIGVSNVTAEQLEVALEVAGVACVENGYNLRRRRRQGPDHALAICDRAGIPYIAWQPLAAGALAHIDETTKSVAARLGVQAGQVALAWLLQCSPITLPIPGTSSVEHLEQNVAAASVRLTDEDVALLERHEVHIGPT